MKDNQSKALYSFANKDVAGLHVHISTGNGKIGHIWNVSTVPGDAINFPTVDRNGEKVRITDVFGSCSGVCGDCHNFCYAFDSIRQHSIRSLNRNGAFVLGSRLLTETT